MSMSISTALHLVVLPFLRATTSKTSRTMRSPSPSTKPKTTPSSARWKSSQASGAPRRPVGTRQNVSVNPTWRYASRSENSKRPP